MLTTTIKNNPKSALALLAAVNPIVAVGVLAVEHKNEIKSTLAPAINEVKKVATEVKKDTIAVASEVKKDVTKVGGAVVGGIQNLYMYGMIAVGAVILVLLNFLNLLEFLNIQFELSYNHMFLVI